MEMAGKKLEGAAKSQPLSTNSVSKTILTAHLSEESSKFFFMYV